MLYTGIGLVSGISLSPSFLTVPQLTNFSCALESTRALTSCPAFASDFRVIEIFIACISISATSTGEIESLLGSTAGVDLARQNPLQYWDGSCNTLTREHQIRRLAWLVQH